MLICQTCDFHQEDPPHIKVCFHPGCNNHTLDTLSHQENNMGEVRHFPIRTLHCEQHQVINVVANAQFLLRDRYDGPIHSCTIHWHPYVSYCSGCHERNVNEFAVQLSNRARRRGVRPVWHLLHYESYEGVYRFGYCPMCVHDDRTLCAQCQI